METTTTAAPAVDPQAGGAEQLPPSPTELDQLLRLEAELSPTGRFGHQAARRAEARRAREARIAELNGSPMDE